MYAFDLGVKVTQTHGDPFIFREVEEKGMLIDWENVADLTSPDVLSQLTNRTVSFRYLYQSHPQILKTSKGTPMFVASAVAAERVKAQEGRPQARCNLPKMRPAIEEWYIKTYGQERYDRYWGAMVKLDFFREYDPEKHFFSHRAFHDAESFLWVIINELMRAWPKGFEEELNETVSRHISMLEDHEFARGADSRKDILELHLSDWKQTLHPRLAFLAPMLQKLATYFSVEWLLWPELPEDHGHEVLKVFLREAILDMIKDEDPIPLKQELRTPKRHGAAIRVSHNVKLPEVISPLKRGSNQQQGSTSKKARMEVDVNEVAVDEVDVNKVDGNEVDEDEFDGAVQF